MVVIRWLDRVVFHNDPDLRRSFAEMLMVLLFVSSGIAIASYIVHLAEACHVGS